MRFFENILSGNVRFWRRTVSKINKHTKWVNKYKKIKKSQKKIILHYFFLFFFLIKKYNFKNIILLFYKFKGRKKWLVFILFFKKFPNHRGILVRKHQKINSSSKLRKIHVQIPKEMTTYAGILVKKKRLRNALVQDCQH